jgi:hypothetical protein
MDSLVTLYHGGRVEIDAYGSVTFDGMKIVTMLFVERPTFDQLLTTTTMTTTTTTLALALAPQVRWRLDRLSCRMLLQLSHHS